jgi:hypothetical protein
LNNVFALKLDKIELYKIFQTFPDIRKDIEGIAEERERYRIGQV